MMTHSVRPAAWRRFGISVLTGTALLASACSVPFSSGDESSQGDSDITSNSLSSESSSSEPSTTSSLDDAQASIATQVLAEGGAVETFRRVEFTVGPTTITSMEPEELIKSSIGEFVSDESSRPDESGAWLVVQLDLDSEARLRWDLRPDDVTLLDQDGRARGTGEIFDRVGARSVTGVDFLSRAHHEIHVAFDVAEFAAELASTQLANWTLSIASDDEIPLLLPVDGSAFTDTYPFPLAHGAESTVFGGTFPACGEGIEMNALIDDASVRLERVDSSDRASSDERVVQIQLAITNPTDADGNCANLGQWPEFFLEVDGRSVSADSYFPGDLERGATSAFDLVFDVPASAQRLALIGGADQRTLASWEVSLPRATGETGPVSGRRVAAPPRFPISVEPSPAELVEVELGVPGGNTTVLGTQFEIERSIATNASLETLSQSATAAGSQSGSVRDEDGRGWLMVDVRMDSAVGTFWPLDTYRVVLEDPNGRGYGNRRAFVDGDNKGSILFDGAETSDFRFVFETPGLITDLAGWSLMIEPDDRAPARLPLDGDENEVWPRDLPASASRNISVGPFPGCTGTEGENFNVQIEQAELDVERLNSFGDLVRTREGSRFLRVDLALTNLIAVPPVFDSTTENCDAVFLWAPFLASADGRFIQPVVFSDALRVEYQMTDSYTVWFPIPEETLSVQIFGGAEPILIGGWDLLSLDEVIEDFEPKEQGEQTLVTLDERVLFAFGSSALSDEATAPLTRLTRVLIEESTGEIVITGHTDSIGDDASNDALSLARAEAVVAFLIEQGVDAGRVVAVGAGEGSPVAANESEDGADNPAGRALNRRVDVLFTTG